MTREKRSRGDGEKRLNEVGMQARAERDQRDGGCVSPAAELWSLLLFLFALSGASTTSTAQISLPSLSCPNKTYTEAHGNKLKIWHTHPLQMSLFITFQLLPTFPVASLGCPGNP